LFLAEMVELPGPATSGFKRSISGRAGVRKGGLGKAAGMAECGDGDGIFRVAGRSDRHRAGLVVAGGDDDEQILILACRTIDVGIVGAVYCPDVPPPQLSLWMRAPPPCACSSVPSKSCT